MLVLFTVLINHYAPDVDVSIGNNSDETVLSQEEEINDDVYLKKFVDNRLLAIQKEDQRVEEQPVEQIQEIQKDESKTDSNNKQSIQKEELKPVELVTQVPEVTLPPIPSPTIQSPAHIEQPLLNATYRVYIGYYHTYDQVKLAKEIVSEADSTITPVIKEVSGGYTLQAGVFKSKEAAVSLTNTLLKEHLPARMITE